MSKSKSQEIKCTVKSCRHHDKDSHCMLSEINVGENFPNASEKSQTDCMSFETF